MRSTVAVFFTCLVEFIAFAGLTTAQTQPCAGSSLGWETSVVHSLNSINSSFISSSANAVSDMLPILSIGVPVGMYSYGSIWSDRDVVETGVLLGTAETIAYSIVFAGKAVAGRERPYHADSLCIQNRSTGLVNEFASFPSGHSAGSVALATMLSLRYPKWYVIAPSFAYAGYVMFSRIHLGVHYPSDILAGALLGAGSAFLVNTFAKEILSTASGVLPNFSASSQGTSFSIVIPLNYSK